MINLKQSLKELDGEPLMRIMEACPACFRPRESKPAILGFLIAEALVRGYRDPRTGAVIEVPGDEAIKRHDLALRIYNTDQMEFEAEEIVLIKSLVEKAYTTLYSAQIIKMIKAKGKEE